MGFSRRPASVSIRLNRSRGAALVEFILTLPVFLFAVFFMMWLGVTWNAQTSLASAVLNGIRLAETRGRAHVYGKEGIDLDWGGSLEVIDAWKKGVGQAEETVISLLVSDPPPFAEGGQVDKRQYMLNYYDKVAETIFPDLGQEGLRGLPTEYTYAIVYAIQAMKMSVGKGSLKYPCFTTSQQNEFYGGGILQDMDGTKADNCLFCRPVNLKTLEDEEYAVDSDYPLNSTLEIAKIRIGIRCDYKPSSTLLSLIQRSLAAATLGLVGNSTGMTSISFGQLADNYSGCLVRRIPIVGTSGHDKKLCCVNEPCFMTTD